VISTDLDYHITQKDRSEYLGLIPNPVNLDTIPFNDLNLDSKITIFHGVNKLSHIRKGNHYFNKALDIVQQKYSDKIKIKEVNSLPYSEYIESYNDAHIVLDAVYGFDQGYNALEAMAKGKVVLTGAEDIWLNYYHLEKDTIAINAEPDAQAIAIKLEWLVLNPEKILEISKNARAFIEREHDYRKIALKYLDVWQNKMQH
jgi:predicted SpoU family rRNA methylase